MNCPFCRASLDDIVEEKETECPRCGAIVLLLREFDPRLLKAHATATISPNAQIAVCFTPSSQYYTIAMFDPDELLTTRQVAKLLSVSRDRVSHLAKQGCFPNAKLRPGKRGLGKRGTWQIPREDVLAYLLRTKERS